MESLASGRSEGAGALDEERPPLTSSEVESPPAEAGQRGTVSLHLRYHALLRRSRLLGVAFWAAMAYFIVWAVPWFPGGLTETDYTKRITLTLVIGGICALLGLGTLVLRQNLRRTTEALLAWSTVYDDTTGLFNRRYFLDRLSLECERARRQGTTFSLILLRLEDSAGGGQGLGTAALRRLATSLVRATRSNDLVALLGGNELAVVAMDVPRKMAPQMVDRLKTALEGSSGDLSSRLSLRLGVATYGTRNRQTSTLLRAARRALSGEASPEDADDKEESAA